MTRRLAFNLVMAASLAVPAAAFAQQQSNEAAPAQQSAPAQADEAQARQVQAAQPAGQRPAVTADELAALRSQLRQAFKASGVPKFAEQAESGDDLDQVARRSNYLSKNLSGARSRLEARDLELKVYNELANRAQQRKDNKEASYRYSQLRAAAWSTKQMKSSAASALGDFWLLQAALFDINNATPDPQARRDAAIERLERFLRDQANGRAGVSAVATPGSTRQQLPQSVQRGQAQGAEEADPAVEAARAAVLRDVKLSLLRLYDQQGMTDRAAGLVAQMLTSPDIDAATRRNLAQWFGYVGLLGQRFDANLEVSAADARSTQPTAQPATQPGAAREQVIWSSRAHQGKVVLIHFWADWFAPSKEAFAGLTAAQKRWGGQGFEVLSVRLPDRPVAQTKVRGAAAGDGQVGGAATNAEAAATPNWPVYYQGSGQVSLQRMFQVRSLPRFVLIDRQGRVASVAGSLAVLDRVAELLGPTASGAQIEAQQSEATEPPAPAANPAPAPVSPTAPNDQR